MEIRYKINPRVLTLAIIGSIMVVMSYLMFAYDPLQMIIKKLIQLSPGTIVYSLWSKPPYEVFIKVYIFNVTNPEEFLAGKEKINFNQIGPYVYQEILTNENSVFNDNGTITFHPRRDLKFRREYSVGDEKEDTFLSPNIPLIGITSSLKDAGWLTGFSLSMAASAANAQPFVSLTVEKYLWGYEDTLVTWANNYIPSWIDFDKFGILDRLMAKDNASNIVTIVTDTTKGVSKNHLLNDDERNGIYHIDRYNGLAGLTQWGYTPAEDNQFIEGNTRCNKIEGVYEGTVFPPNMKEYQDFSLYRPAFCRPVQTRFERVGTSKDGYEAFFYRVDDKFLATPEENPENACYCPKTGCLKKGLGSLAPCYYDIPIAISQPHFYNSDPWLIEQVDGMKPSKEDHDTWFSVHPKLGVPLEGSLRIQINLDVGETKYNALTEPFNNLVLPLFWLEMTPNEIPFVVAFLIRLLYHVLPVVFIILSYLLAILGLGLISGSALLALMISNKITREGPTGPSYSPIPVIQLPIPAQFLPEIKICK